MDRRHLLIAPLLPLMPLMPRLEALPTATEREGPMNEPTQRIVETNGIRPNIAEHGKGPVGLLCHGFPESWYSWRPQPAALAGAGFHAVAPDMRGYGKSDRPGAIDQYTIFHLVGDTVRLIDRRELKSA